MLKIVIMFNDSFLFFSNLVVSIFAFLFALLNFHCKERSLFLKSVNFSLTAVDGFSGQTVLLKKGFVLFSFVFSIGNILVETYFKLLIELFNLLD